LNKKASLEKLPREKKGLREKILRKFKRRKVCRAGEEKQEEKLGGKQGAEGEKTNLKGRG